MSNQWKWGKPFNSLPSKHGSLSVALVFYALIAEQKIFTSEKFGEIYDDFCYWNHCFWYGRNIYIYIYIYWIAIWLFAHNIMIRLYL
jgi:hypothetical protein